MPLHSATPQAATYLCYLKTVYDVGNDSLLMAVLTCNAPASALIKSKDVECSSSSILRQLRSTFSPASRVVSRATDPLASYREECSGWVLRLVVCWVLRSVFDDRLEAYPTYCVSNSCPVCCPSIRQLADGSIGVFVVVVQAGLGASAR
jgi:hypothetical protein